MADITTPTKISLDIYNVKAEVTIPHSDVSADELIRTFCSMMITHTFFPSSIVDTLREVADEMEETYKVIEE